MVLPATPSPTVAGDTRRSPIVVDEDCGGEPCLPVVDLPLEEEDESNRDVVVVDQSGVELAGLRSSARLLTKVRVDYSLIEHRSTSSSPPGAKAERTERKNKDGGGGEDGCLAPAKKRAATSPLARNDASGDSGEVAVLSGVREVVLENPMSKDMSAYARVKETLRQFNSIYLHLVQQEQQRREVDCAKNGKLQKNQANGKVTRKVDANVMRSSRRPDLKAVTEMIERKLVLYPRKIGNLEGIDVGHRFYSRAEMVVLGFHCHWLNGIDYMRPGECNLNGEKIGLPIAVSIIMSGQYEDDVDNLENVVYTGQGGNDLTGKKQQIRDQKLERGNLALKNNAEKKIPVRVTRGHASKDSYVGKVYTYDGLYQVVKYWAEKGVSGYTVYKFQLKRLADQPLLTTNQVYFSGAQVPRSSKDVHGLVSEDISGGLESRPIPATNLVDIPPLPPSGYIYCNALQIKENVRSPPVASGCNCEGSCVNTRECSCAKLNGSAFPYVQQGGGSRLIEAKAVVFECGPACGCGPACINRTSQQGLRYNLEVFRTPNRGWGVRSWDHIPPGAPICEYKGVLMSTDELDTVVEDTFVFEIDCLQTMKGLDGRESRRGVISANAHTYLDSSDDKVAESVPEFCIDAGPLGNVSRFINHSCQPNLFVQCVLSSHHDIKQARIVLFASEHIPPLQELTYDYGYALDSVVGSDGHIKKMPCFCGAIDCRKRLY